MQTVLRGKDYIETPDWTKEELETVLDVAGDLKRRFRARRAAPAVTGQDVIHDVLRAEHTHAQLDRRRR